MEQKVRVAIVGAGISGLAALKECLQAGLDAQVFEARPEVGGAWAYEPCSFDSGRSDVHSSVYQGTILNSCRDTTSFTDFPFDPARYGDYFGHKQMLQYLHEYAEQFDLKKHIRFQTRVLDCRPRGFGKDGWDVTVQRIDMAPEQAIFTAVLACTGHVSRPKTPAFKNRESFQGKFFHSHLYRTPGPFEGKRVAIIGLGSSAVDIACEVAPQAEDLHIITRRGGWILPRYVLGKPTEAWDNRATQLWVPLSLSQWLQTKLLNLVELTLPKGLTPDHKILEQNPTIRGDFREKVRTGLITIHRALVDSFTETGIRLSNGESLDVDVVICCTGYEPFHLPYLPADSIRSPDAPPNTADLYKFIMTPHYFNLFFLGFIELFGPLPPAVEAQARHIAAMLEGRIPRPSQETMVAHIKSFRAWQEKTFIHSERHILTSPQIEYIDSLLTPLGAVPSFPRLLGKVFTSSNPWKAMKILNAVWFGIPSSAQWRLTGHGKKEQLARETVLRIADAKQELSRGETSYLTRAI